MAYTYRSLWAITKKGRVSAVAQWAKIRGLQGGALRVNDLYTIIPGTMLKARTNLNKIDGSYTAITSLSLSMPSIS